MSYQKLILRVHALRRMAQRRIGEADMRSVVAQDDVIEDYPNDTPYPSRLLVGWIGQRPLHVVAADNHAAQETIVITVYEPDPARWSPDFRRRQP